LKLREEVIKVSMVIEKTQFPSELLSTRPRAYNVTSSSTETNGLINSMTTSLRKDTLATFPESTLELLPPEKKSSLNS
jgi:hypothetical protein